MTASRSARDGRRVQGLAAPSSPACARPTRSMRREAADAAKALSAAGAIVHLAGRPGEHEAAWNAAGVETYIYVGCDVLATLARRP